jgi:hypothetical protein
LEFGQVGPQVCNKYDVSDNEILQIHTTIKARDYKKYMELYRSWLHKKQIELVTLTTTSIAIELGRPKTHKKWGAFLNNGENDMRGDVAMKSNI